MSLAAQPPARGIATLHDAARLLALIDLSAFSVVRGAVVHRDALRLAARHVSAGAPGPTVQIEADAPAAGWLLRTLMRLGLAAAVDGALRLSGTAHEWLADPLDRQLGALVSAWAAAPETAWAWLLAATQAGRREAADLAALTMAARRLVEGLPPGAWVVAAELTRAIANAAPAPTTPAARLPRARAAAEERAARYAAFLVAQLLPRLGVLDFEPGPPAAVALTPWGQGALSVRTPPAAADPDPAPAAAAPAGPLAPAGWSAADPLVLTPPHDLSPAATFELMHLAEFTPDPPTYRFSPDTVARAATLGYSFGKIEFLLGRLGAPLPPAALSLLSTWYEELNLIYCEPGYRLAPHLATHAAGLRQRERFRSTATPLPGAAAFYVPATEARALFTYLRRSGYQLAPAPETAPPGMGGPPALAPLLRRTLPLAALAVLTGVRIELHALVPGLARLDLADFAAACRASLGPAERAGVDTLVRSDVALLRGALASPGQIDRGSNGGAGEDGQASSAAQTAETTADVASQLAVALLRGVTVEIGYADTRAEVTRRTVRPLRLERRRGRAYLVGFCDLRQDERSFRLDRIVTARPTPP